VVEVEWVRLRDLGRGDLARRVDRGAATVGDGLGFDVLSFDEADESERLIEVKTTGLGKYFPFFVTATEVNCSEDVPDRFHLYRVFDFATRPGCRS
jgi:Protein NO VEIN, C-terminal